MNRSDVFVQTGMAKARANGIELCYQTFGDPADPPLLLIMGLAAQMVVWDEDFCELLATKGYRVIRFDNRDIGESTWVKDGPAPTMSEVLTMPFTGKKIPVAYTLRDMAGDTAGLLEALGYDSAHVVGLSMGGMIAQELAVHFPERVRTLTSIMSSTGDPSLPQATPAALAVLSRELPPDKDGYVQSYVRAWAVLNGDLLPFNAERTARTASISFDRGLNPAGVARQMLAIISSGNRTEALGSLDVPALVIHGTNDPLVPPEAGHATARAIPGAKLELVEGMGHTLPRQIWPQIADAIAAHAREAEPHR
jgi:pimeloyl-ACP methyl ester carboxylesterase